MQHTTIQRYPKFFIRNESKLAKYISRKGFSEERALTLINEVMTNFEHLWKDNKKESEPEKGKYVRNAKGSQLGRLLKKIDLFILTPYDELLPPFIFGGISKRNHVLAAQHLRGNYRKPTLLNMDLSRFFEQINSDRVKSFFQYKCYCTEKIAKLLSNLCCVPVGPKENPGTQRVLARGFPTSPRLAVWCNLDTFIKLDRLVQKRLKGKDPRLSIYVDDIGITASRVPKEEMDRLLIEIKELLLSDRNQTLLLNPEKTQTKYHHEGLEYVGIRFERGRLRVGKKAIEKLADVQAQLQKTLHPEERARLKRRRKGMLIYKRYVEKLGNNRADPSTK